MASDATISTRLSDDLERFETEEMLQWAHEKDYFGGQSFVWDGRDRLDLNSMIVADTVRAQREPDELLFANLSRNEPAPLPSDRRRRRGRAQDC
jgi:hypothetical protein